MTLLQTIMGDYAKSVIGFENMFDSISKTPAAFPRYNVSKTENNKYLIELAVAGFGKSDISVTVDGNSLVISGEMNSEHPVWGILYQGISNRSFTKKFALGDGMVVNGASLANGILKIALEQISGVSTPRKIEIEDEASTVTEYAARNPVMLTEEDRENAHGKLM